LTLEADGSFTYTPAANFVGTDSFTYKANDGALDSNVATATITVTPTTSASFLGADMTTLGAWRSAYGGDGYDIAQDTSGSNPVIPAYAQVAIVGASTYTWGTGTGNPAALQDAAGASDIAATWYAGSSFDIDVTITDGKAHRVALYALDWDQVVAD